MNKNGMNPRPPHPDAAFTQLLELTIRLQRNAAGHIETIASYLYEGKIDITGARSLLDEMARKMRDSTARLEELRMP